MREVRTLVRVADISSAEYLASIESHVVVLPIGAIEAHGPHLPLATDTVIATFLADEVDAKLKLDVLVLPPLSYGQKTEPSRAGGVFPGITNLRASTLTSVVLDILRASYGQGARRFLILHAHIANVPVVFEAVDVFVAESPGARVMAASWWDFTSEDTRNAIASETGVPRTEDHHAAMVETSLMLHIRPEAVRTDLLSDDASERRATYVVMPTPDSLQTRSGVVFQASRASAQIGDRLMNEIVRNLLEAVELELA